MRNAGTGPRVLDRHTTPRPTRPNGCLREPDETPMLSSLVVHDELSDIRIIRQHRGANRRRDYVNVPSLGKLSDERRGQNHVADKARLYHERRRHRSLDLQDSQERLLRDLHRTHLFHTLLPLFLLLQQFTLPADIATIALG